MDLLLGEKVYFQIMLSGVRKNPENALIAQQTVFGFGCDWQIRRPIRYPLCPKRLQTWILVHLVRVRLLEIWDPAITEPRD